MATLRGGHQILAGGGGLVQMRSFLLRIPSAPKRVQRPSIRVPDSEQPPFPLKERTLTLCVVAAVRAPPQLTGPAAVIRFVDLRPRSDECSYDDLPPHLVPRCIVQRCPAVEVLGVDGGPRGEQEQDGINGSLEGGEVQQREAPGRAVVVKIEMWQRGGMWGATVITTVNPLVRPRATVSPSRGQPFRRRTSRKQLQHAFRRDSTKMLFNLYCCTPKNVPAHQPLSPSTAVDTS